MAEQKRLFHSKEVTPMSAQERLRGYEQRLRMEAASPFGNVKWRNVGPEIQGGRVVDIQGSRSNLYVAYATGGLWKTTDQGITWTPLFDNQSAVAIGSFAIAPDGKTIWVGSGENNSQRTSYAGMGVFKSTDGGASWQNMGLADTHRIGRVLIDPKNPNTVYVAAIGHLYSKNAERGVFKTTDGGRTWTHSLKIDPSTGVIDLAMDPSNPNVLYAAAWERERRAWNFLEGGPESALYKSTDAGKTWHKLTNGLPLGETGRVGVATSPSNPHIVYAFVDNQAPDEDEIYKDEFTASDTLTIHRFRLMTDEQLQGVPENKLSQFLRGNLPNGMQTSDVVKKIKAKTMGVKELSALMEEVDPDIFNEEHIEQQLFRSDDDGKTWKRLFTGNIGYTQVGYYAGRITVNPKDAMDVYLTGPIMIHSTDGGKTWAQIARSLHADFHAYFIDPADTTFRAVGNDGGLYLSYDSGNNWRHIENMAVGQFTTIAVDNAKPYNIYGGLQDNGTMKGPSTYQIGRSSPTAWTSINGGDGAAVAIDPREDANTVYSGSQFGSETGFDAITNDRWFFSVPAPKDKSKQRFNWVSPILISPHHPDIIYFASQRLYRSLDRGKTWEVLGGDLTKNLPNGDVPFSTIKDVSESPFRFGVIYIGSDDGTVKVTQDHGRTWDDISTPAKDKWVSRVIASKWDAATVYVAQNGYRDDDFAPYLWKSTDFGKHWTSIVGDLPTECINVVREDPTRKDLLYVGTDMGVFVSYNGGAKWEPLNGGMPHAPVHDLAIQAREGELVAATHSRSVWVLKLKQIYDLDKDLRAKDLFIFPVSNMTRSARWGLDNKADWDTSPTRAVPLNVEVWTKQSGPAQLQIIDKDGKVVKEKQVQLLTGYNTVDIDLKLEDRKYGIVDPKKREIKTTKDALADPYESERPKFLEAGEYKIQIIQRGNKFSVSWKLTSPS